MVWLPGNLCVELLLPSGEVRCSVLAADIKAGSRQAATSVPARFYVLENGTSRIWQAWRNDCRASTQGGESFLHLNVLVPGRWSWAKVPGPWATRRRTGTPHHGAHSPWLFDLETQRWQALPAAPHAILSSAVAVQPDGLEVTILGGWSKMSSCHGHVQKLTPGQHKLESRI